MIKILFLGDIIGKPGRRSVKRYLEKIGDDVDFVVANVENSAGGFGITPPVFNELKEMGIDVMTSGNHIWDKKDGARVLDEYPQFIIRPANYPPGVMGRGFVVRDVDGISVAVINLQGRVFMEPIDDPFRKAEEILEEISSKADIILVDFHAEATAEKYALSWFLDGKVTAIFGTHTHVQTADERVLPRGTFYITDAGMCGSVDSVIGTRIEDALRKFRYQTPVRFNVARGNEEVQGVLLEIEEGEKPGKVKNFKRIKEKVEGE